MARVRDEDTATQAKYEELVNQRYAAAGERIGEELSDLFHGLNNYFGDEGYDGDHIDPSILDAVNWADFGQHIVDEASWAVAEEILLANAADFGVEEE